MTKLIQLLKAISETSYVTYIGEPFNLDIAICEIESMQQQLADIKNSNRELIELIQTANSNLEAQEIMIADYKKHIAEYEEWYIHRNEAQGLQDKNTGYMLKHIEELKRRIEELEAPKNCEGCKYLYRLDLDSRTKCLTCIRYCIGDYYEPKDKE